MKGRIKERIRAKAKREKARIRRRAKAREKGRVTNARVRIMIGSQEAVLQSNQARERPVWLWKPRRRVTGGFASSKDIAQKRQAKIRPSSRVFPRRAATMGPLRPISERNATTRIMKTTTVVRGRARLSGVETESSKTMKNATTETRKTETAVRTSASRSAATDRFKRASSVASPVSSVHRVNTVKIAAAAAGRFAEMGASTRVKNVMNRS